MTLTLNECINDVCPLTGRPVAADALMVYRGCVVGFADRVARDDFRSMLVAIETAIAPAPTIELDIPAEAA
jgi:hypothetical protein